MRKRRGEGEGTGRGWGEGDLRESIKIEEKMCEPSG